MESYQLSRNDFITMLNNGARLISGPEIVKRKDDNKQFTSYRLRDTYGNIIENREPINT